MKETKLYITHNRLLHFLFFFFKFSRTISRYYYSKMEKVIYGRFHPTDNMILKLDPI